LVQAKLSLFIRQEIWKQLPTDKARLGFFVISEMACQYLNAV